MLAIGGDAGWDGTEWLLSVECQNCMELFKCSYVHFSNNQATITRSRVVKWLPLSLLPPIGLGFWNCSFRVWFPTRSSTPRHPTLARIAIATNHITTSTNEHSNKNVRAKQRFAIPNISTYSSVSRESTARRLPVHSAPLVAPWRDFVHELKLEGSRRFKTSPSGLSIVCARTLPRWQTCFYSLSGPQEKSIACEGIF